MSKSSNGPASPSTGGSITQAFVLGAGLGTRLRPLTAARPKPLIPLGGRPLITHAFDHLLAAGVRRFVVNTHHLAPAYAVAFPQGEYRGAPIAFRHEPELLDTGGGIANIANLLEDAPFLVYNGDVLATLPLEPAIAHHLATEAEATLILRSHGGPLHLRFVAEGSGPAGHITDIRNRLGHGEGTHLFTGIYLLSPRFLRRLPPGESSVIAAFLQMIAEGTPPAAIVLDEGGWWDLGTRDQYLAAHRRLQGSAPLVDPTASVHPTARLSGATWVGPGCTIGPGAEVRDSLLWNDARLGENSLVERCILTDGQTVSGTHRDTDF